MRKALLLATVGVLLGFVACQNTPPAELSVSQNDYSVESGGGSVNISVSTNVDLTVRISEGWITQSGTPSGGSGTYSFTVAHNDGYDARTATITFSNGEQGVSETVTITQAQQDAIIPGNLEYKLFYESQTLSLPVSSNVDYTVSVSGGDWIKSLGTRGLTSKEHQFSIAENTGKTPREAVVTITSGSLKQSIKVVQLPTTHMPETTEEWKESVILNEEINKAKVEIFQQIEQEGITDVSRIADALSEINGVIDVIPNSDGSVISMMQKDSIWIDIMLYDPTRNVESSMEEEYSYYLPSHVSQEGTGIPLIGTRASSNENDRHFVKHGGKALILSPYQWQFKYPVDSWYTLLSKHFDVDSLLNSHVDVRYFIGEIPQYLKSKVSKIDEYDFILFATHGGYRTIYSPLPLSDKDVNTFCTGTVYSEDTQDIYDYLKKKGLRVITGTVPHSDHSNFEIIPDYLDNTSFDNTAVILAACYSAKTGTMVNKLRDNGASFVSGNNTEMWDSAIETYVNNMLYCLCGGLSFIDAHNYSTKSELSEQWTTYVKDQEQNRKDLRDSPVEVSKGDLDAWDICNQTRCFPEKADIHYFFISPFPVLKSPTNDNHAISWTCNLSPFTTYWTFFHDYWIDEDGTSYSSIDKVRSYHYTVLYSVYIDGSFKTSTSEKSFDISNLSIGEHKAYVVAKLMVGEGNRELYSYKSDELTFNVEKVSDYINVTTTSAKSITAQGALIPVSYETNWSPNIVERGVVYSSTRQMPETRFSDCQTRKYSGSGNNFQVQLTGLTPGITYYARGYVSVEDKEACTLYYGNVVEFTTESQPVGRVSVSVDPTSITFKDTEVGDSSVEAFTIINDGDVPLTKVGAYTSGGPFDFDNQTAGVILYPGQKIEVFVRFTPQKEGEFNTTIIVAAMTDVQDAPEIDIKVTGKGIKNSSQITYNSTVVDLGLSVKWAACNLGASSPEQFGEYYSWGETDVKSSYSWSNYTWCKGSEKTLTKYCWIPDYGYNGFVDYKTQLEQSDDAAYSKLKGSFRIPSTKEWRELLEKCSWTWTSNYQGTGVSGYIVKSKVSGYTNKSIFLPAAGYSWYSDIGVGNYMSSTALNTAPGGYDVVYFTSNEIYGANFNSFCSTSSYYDGCSIRPVQGNATTVKMSVSPTSLNFGEVALKTENRINIEFTNTGNTDIVVHEAKLQSGSSGYSLDVQIGPNLGKYILYAGDNSNFPVIFCPKKLGKATDKLILQTSAGTITIPLSGTGVEQSTGPMIKLARSEIDYGTVNVGAAVSTGLIITNTGDEVLKLTKVSLVEGNNYFSMPFESNYQGKEIAPGATTTITVKFNPTKAGEYVDQLMIKSNATNYSYNLVILKGKATN